MPTARKAAPARRAAKITPALTPRSPAAAPPAPVLSDELSQVQKAYAHIEHEIATLALAPGQVVSENMLATRFGLGRTPVREALQQLAREGLVVILPNRGIIVSQLDVRQQLRLLEARRYVEQGVVALASLRADAAQRERFLALAVAMEASAAQHDGVAFLALDAEFNQLLLAAARNDHLSACMRLMQGLARRFWYAHYQTSADLPETARLHAAIARAVAAQDDVQAQQALVRLLDNVERFTRSTLDAPAG